MVIAIDFDGTLVDHRFPAIGDEVPGAFDWLQKFQESGAKLILWTARKDGFPLGTPLTDAVEFCRDRGVVFWAVNENPDQPHVLKAFAHLYIDDAAFGCPLLDNPVDGGRPFVYWAVVGPRVMDLIETHQNQNPNGVSGRVFECNQAISDYHP